METSLRYKIIEKKKVRSVKIPTYTLLYDGLYLFLTINGPENICKLPVHYSTEDKAYECALVHYTTDVFDKISPLPLKELPLQILIYTKSNPFLAGESIIIYTHDYKNLSNLIDVVNEKLATMIKTPPKLVYTASTRKLNLINYYDHVKNQMITLDTMGELGKFLNLPPYEENKESVTVEIPEYPLIANLHLHCDLLLPSVVNNKLSPLLHMIKKDENVNNPLYMRIAKRNFETLKFSWKNENGDVVPTPESKTQLLLHIKEKEKRKRLFHYL